MEYIKSYRKIRENLLENRGHNNLRGEVVKRNSPCGEAERNSQFTYPSLYGVPRVPRPLHHLSPDPILFNLDFKIERAIVSEIDRPQEI